MKLFVVCAIVIHAVDAEELLNVHNSIERTGEPARACNP